MGLRRGAGAASSLKRVDVDALAIRRVGGKRFRYVTGEGRPVTDPATLRRIAALAIPPAYRDVRICGDADGHLQATGRDARGRMQYRYHPAWREARDRGKFRRLRRFAECLPALRRRVERDLARPETSREAVLGAVVRLLETTLARVGSEEYARANGSFGLTTLRPDHVAIRGAEIRLRFPGKGGKDWNVRLRSRRVARILDRCRRLPGETLFRYRDAGGAVRRIRAADVNAYLRAVAGQPITARDFRTWAGTALVAKRLLAGPRPRGVTAARRSIREAIASTAAELGNTPAICRKAYVDPVVLERFEAGTLQRVAKSVAPKKGLREEEGVIATLLGR